MEVVAFLVLSLLIFGMLFCCCSMSLVLYFDAVRNMRSSIDSNNSSILPLLRHLAWMSNFSATTTRQSSTTQQSFKNEISCVPVDTSNAETDMDTSSETRKNDSAAMVESREEHTLYPDDAASRDIESTMDSAALESTEFESKGETTAMAEATATMSTSIESGTIEQTMTEFSTEA